MVGGGVIVVGARRHNTRRRLRRHRWIHASPRPMRSDIFCLDCSVRWRRNGPTHRYCRAATLPRWYWLMPCRRRIIYHHSRVPLVPSARPPHPSIAAKETPLPVPVRRPSPRITRYPNVSLPWIKRPVSVRIRIPTSTHRRRLPHQPVAWSVEEAAIAIQVAVTIRIWRTVVLILRVLINVLGALLVVIVARES